MKRMIKVAPSLLACDFAKLEEEIRDIERAKADLLHLDIMDGHYVPNISFGPVIVKAIHTLTTLSLDVHLMITNPDIYAPRFIESGADTLTFHIEVKNNPMSLIKKIKSLGCKAGISLNPDTPIEALDDFLHCVDAVLVMSVNPGFGGQQFMNSSLGKIKYLKRIKEERTLKYTIAVDGGINTENAPELIASGVETLIAGTTIFRSKNRVLTIQRLRGNKEKA